ncbi:AaceriAFR656Cp [[Ashbya] aceris (nom. inval.)]|nr:AaceriAFR656Cp [[Ashbya] aceris (nom. inval.)]
MQLRSAIIHRDEQLKLLNCFIHDDPTLSPPNLIIHGPRSSGKTSSLKHYFSSHTELQHCWINAIEMVTGKPFAQHIAVKVSRLLRESFPIQPRTEYDPLSAEDFSLLVKFLYNLFSEYETLEKRHCVYVILDNFDQIEELDVELLPKFLKIDELLPKFLKLEIRFVPIIQSTSFLHHYSTYNIPTIVFPRYNLPETRDIVHYVKDVELSTCSQLVSKVEGYETEEISRLCLIISKSYIDLIIESFHSYSGNDPVLLMELVDAKWSQYINAIDETNYKDTPALYRANLELFRRTGDTFLEQDDEEDTTSLATVKSDTGPASSAAQNKTTTYGLCTMSKYLLIAAYLTSYLNPRFDSKVFSKKSHLRAGRSAYGRRNKMDTNPRYLQPSLFSLERMLAIFQSIYPVTVTNEVHPDFIQKDQHMRANVEVYENLAELNSLKLITSAINKSVDYLHEKIKWKVNVPWEIIIEVANTVDFDIAEYFSDIHE